MTPLPAPGTDSAWDLRDHAPLLGEDKFALNEERFVSTSLSSGQLSRTDVLPYFTNGWMSQFLQLLLGTYNALNMPGA